MVTLGYPASSCVGILKVEGKGRFTIEGCASELVKRVKVFQRSSKPVH